MNQNQNKQTPKNHEKRGKATQTQQNTIKHTKHTQTRHHNGKTKEKHATQNTTPHTDGGRKAEKVEGLKTESQKTLFLRVFKNVLSAINYNKGVKTNGEND